MIVSYKERKIYMKKIISILLALTAALSFFAISASARVLGDVNNDKKANSSDALKILQYSVGIIDEINEKSADVNCDGQINSVDALIVLNISIENYDGPTEVELKETVIDPIIETGKFTLSTTVETDEGTTPVTIMVKGSDMCVSMKVSGLNVRMLMLKGKAYIVFPIIEGVTGYYTEIDSSELDGIDFSNIALAKSGTYTGSKYVTQSGKKYTVDSYKYEDGSTSDFYFLNGKWVKSVSVTDGVQDTQEISEFKSGVTDSYFSLKGYSKIDASNLAI